MIFIKITIKKYLLVIIFIFSLFVIFGCGSSTPNADKVAITVVNGEGTGVYEVGNVAEVKCDDKDFKEWRINEEVVSTSPVYQFVVRSSVVVVAVIHKEVEKPSIFKEEKLSTDNLIAYRVSNTSQIKQDKSAPKAIDANVGFSAAKGERETAQLMLQAKNNLVYKILDVKFTDLYNGDYVISSSNIEIYLEKYVNVKSNWDAFDDSPSSWYPNGKTELELGYFPDALIPLDVAKAEGLDKVTIKQNNNLGLFFVINVPKNSVKGTYVGQVEISLTGEDALILPVELNVFNFTMPQENRAKTMINIALSEMIALYPGVDNSSKFYTELWNMLKERGISGGGVSGSPWGTNTIDNYIENLKIAAKDPDISVYNIASNYTTGITINISYKDNKGITKKETLTDMVILDYETTKYSDSVDILGFKDIFKYMVEESTNEVNLFKKAIMYFPQADEPSNLKGYVQNILCQNVINLSRDWCLANCDFTGKDEVKKSLENFKYIVTSEPIDELYNGYKDFKITSFEGTNACALDNIVYKTVDGYIPLYKNFLKDSKTYNNIMKAIKDDSKCIWWYCCIQPVAPYANYELNSPMIAARVNRWQQFSLGVEGELFYMCNRTQTYFNGESIKNTEEKLFNAAVTYEGSYNDGLFVYPVYNLFSTYNEKASVPIYYLSSLRLENVSEGIDDYNYLVYAQSLIDNLSNATLKAQYQAEFNIIFTTLFNDVVTNTTDYNLLDAARLKVVNIIEKITTLR